MNRALVRVLHVITRLDPGGSAENTLLTVAGLDPERFASTLAVGPTRGEASLTEARARQSGVEFLEVPCLVRPINPVRDMLAVRVLWRIMRRGNFQIVHTHTSKGGLLGRIAARLAGVPVVIHTPHGHVFYGYYGRLLSRLFVGLERWAAGFTDRIVALTQREVEEYAALGVAPPEKCAVIHSGVDFAPFANEDDSRQTVRAGWGISAGVLVIGTVGRLTAVKGQADLLDAFALLRERGCDAWLVLVGEGEERENLEMRARRLGIAERVRIPGWRDDVQRALRALDIFALPSLNEGMGKALVEAMYAGLPSVAAAVGGVPELIESGRQGILVEPGNPEQLAAALAELAADPQRRGILGTAARERSAGYSSERMIEKIEALYEELLEEKGLA